MNKRILIVDDDDGILDALEAMLISHGYDVQTSADGDALGQLTKETSPDLILLDVLLSGKDGRDLCKKLKRDRVNGHIPVIMISADPSVSEGVDRCGADGFVSKPFEVEELLQEIARYI